MKFVDEVSFGIASGNGGNGIVSWRREKYVPRGGPDGGDGGRGGAVIFRASRSRNTLVDFRFNKVYRGGNGQPGGARDMTGRSGEDTVLLVPVGTVLSDDETGELLADLDREGAEWSLGGGRGGRGNHAFATATHRTPTEAEPGRPGTEMRVHLELRLLADVGLCGLPNAGKSTLISRLSAARPKIADYPFTTLVPNLGVVSVGEGRSFVVADLPGLIAGAAEGAGLGHRFLRHLDRCRVLVHVVAADLEEPPDEAFRTIRDELEAFDPALVERDQIVVLSKRDLLPPDELAARVAALQAAVDPALGDVIPVSSATGEGLPRLVEAMWALLHRDDRDDRDDPDPDPDEGGDADPDVSD
ncbi:MAG: GTPase ObgE [Myxococcota bacterium]